VTDRRSLDDMTSDQLDQLHDELDRLHARRNQLAGTLYTVLSQFTHKGHPGEPCVQTGWVREDTVKGWWDILHQLEPRPAATKATNTETTARVFAALHQSAEQDVTRVIDLYERWVKAGPPPLGVPLARWWDARLAQLHAALDQPKVDQTAGHLYLSTGCWHGDEPFANGLTGHEYCQNRNGILGAKKPARCKGEHCGAPCVCPCHNTAPAATEATDADEPARTITKNQEQPDA
jgi:hypothetical protein